MADQVKTVLLEFDVRTGKIIGGTKAVNEELERVGARAKLVKADLEKLSTTQEKLAGSAGIAGAAATELGRTISDLPFGLTAITNNVSQLGNMFALLVTSAGGVKNAFIALRTTLLGPVGILVLFQAAVAGLELYGQRSRKAKQEVSDFNFELEAQAQVLREILILKERGSITDVEEEKILRNFVKINKDLVGLLKEGLITEDEKNKLIERSIELNTLKSIGQINEENQSKRLKQLQKELLEFTEKRDKVDKAIRVLKRDEYFDTVEISKREEFLEQLKRRVLEIESEKLNIYKSQADEAVKIGEIESDINKTINDAIKKKERLLDLEKERAGALSSLLSAEETQEERLVSESILEQDEKAFKQHFKRLSEIRATQLFNQREQELKDVQDPTIINAIEERYRLLFLKLNNEISNAFRNGLRQVGTDLNKVDLTLKEVGTTFDQLAEGRSILLSLGFDFDSASDLLVEAGEESVKEFQKRQASQGERNFFVDTFGVSEENLKAGIEATQTALNTFADIFASEAEREIAIETNKTNRINDQLRQRLANEQLSANERDKINQQIARNEAKLVAKENEINKKRFEQEKAVNIALATVNTFSAATGVLAETKGDFFARIAGMIAVIGAGLAQVAIIAKQQFVGKALPSPNLSAQGSLSGTAPEFNTVGSSGINQLAETIQAQQQRPVKTYVVAGEVSTAQALERNIIREAGI